MRMLFQLLLFMLLISTSTATDELSIPDYIESITVGIDCAYSGGTGIVFRRKDQQGNDVTFIWTCAHVVSMRNSRILTFFSLQTLTNAFPKFNEFIILQPVVKNGITINTNCAKAELIKMDEEETGGHDLALLKVKGKFYGTNTVHFYLGDGIPAPISTPIYNVASPYENYGSFSKGMITYVGRMFFKKAYDQVDLVVFPGSSGSGAFLTNGVCIGIVEAMRAPNIGFIIPMRRIREWTKKQNLEWAIDPTIPMPTEDWGTNDFFNDLIKK